MTPDKLVSQIWKRIRRSFTGSVIQETLKSASLSELVNPLASLDTDAASHITFSFESMAQDLLDTTVSQRQAVTYLKYAASMIPADHPKSAEAVATALSKYTSTGGDFSEDNHFSQKVAAMSQAIIEDPIELQETADLGISQALRLRKYLILNSPDADQSDVNSDGPELTSLRQGLASFPTVGGEFHLSPDPKAKVLPYLKERVALLNMAQFQRRSFIPLSGRDKDVLEIRMNPSTYPVSVANWEMMSRLVPELGKTYFSLTLGRRDRNFSHDDAGLILKLRSLASINFAAAFKNPDLDSWKGELHFGEWAFSQTVRIKDGRPELTGGYSSSLDQGSGQLNIFSGLGDLYSPSAYYSSMGVVEPTLLDYITPFQKLTHRPSDAVDNLNEQQIESIYKKIDASISQNYQLAAASTYGRGVVSKLVPNL